MPGPAAARVWIQNVRLPEGVPLNPYIYSPNGQPADSAGSHLANDHGRFLIRDVTAGVYLLHAAAEGFSSIDLPAGKPWRADIPFRLTAEQNITDFEVLLVPSPSVEVQVRGPGSQQARVLAEGSDADIVLLARRRIQVRPWRAIPARRTF